MPETKPWEDYAAAPPSAPWSDYQQQPAGAATPGYRGSVLPVSVDEQGNPQFDINAGITGSILRAFKAPGDAYTGALPVIGPDGHTTPEANARAGEFAALASPVNPAVRAGEYAIPGAMRQGMPQKIAPPTAAELKAAGGQQLEAARASGMELHGQEVTQLGNGIKDALRIDKGIIPETAPQTHAIIDRLMSPPEGARVSLPEITAARSGLSDLSRMGGTEGTAAGRAVQQIDQFLGALPDTAIATPPTGMTPAEVAGNLTTGRANYAAAMRSNDITGTLDRANTGISDRAALRADAANSGMNLDNSLRSRVTSMLEKPKEVAGYSDAEIQALTQFVQGGALRNRARDVGNIAGGGGGLGTLASIAVGSGAGSLLGGIPGAGAGALVAPAIGYGAKALQNHLAEQQLAAIDAMLRSRSPMAEGLQANAPAWAPGWGAQFGNSPSFLSTAGRGMATQLPFGSIAPPPPPPKKRGGRPGA